MKALIFSLSVSTTAAVTQFGFSHTALAQVAGSNSIQWGSFADVFADSDTQSARTVSGRQAIEASITGVTKDQTSRFSAEFKSCVAEVARTGGRVTGVQVAWRPEERWSVDIVAQEKGSDHAVLYTVDIETKDQDHLDFEFYALAHKCKITRSRSLRFDRE
jgi:hypothetical protein